MVQKDSQKVMAIGISLFLSLMLWIYVMGERNPVQSRMVEGVKVTLVNTENIAASNLVLLPNQQFTVNLNVSGRVKDLISLRADDFNLVADMSGYLKKGENEIPVEVKTLPSGITIDNNNLPKISIKLDSLSSKYVPVKISISGSKKEGFESTTPVANPNGVMITGPKTYVDQVDKVVGKIEVSDNEGNVKAAVPVKPVDAQDKPVENISVEPKLVNVSVDIKPYKEVPIVIKTIGKLPDNMVLKEVKSKMGSIKIVGEKKVIDNIKAIETVPYDLSKVTASVTKEVGLVIPEGVTTVSNINAVGVEFKVDSKTQKEIKSPIALTGKNDAYDYALSDENALITLVGMTEALNAIEPSDVLCTIDASSLKEGQNVVNINVTLNKTGEVSKITPEKVTVNVTKK